MFAGFAQSRSNFLFIILGILTILIIGFLDYLTGSFPLSIFYLIPIGIITWQTGIPTGILTSIACALIYFFDSYTDQNFSAGTSLVYWNSAIILGYFLIFMYGLHKMKSTLEREKLYARTDYLTEAFNSRAFGEYADSEINRSRRFGRQLTIAYLDLDDFKLINDEFGHKAGDELLCLVARTIKGNLRKNDIVARIGGDEFAVLLPETTSEQAKTAIDKVLEKLSHAMLIHRTSVTFSIGVATFLRPPSSVDEMIGIADSIMYSSKTEGKNHTKYAVIKEDAS
ncbi:MAG: GGDEF domain-containing protein [Geobacteraceae bacterium]|nr:GGDEF domain-containing protein [Geobacteraceae bacterium]